MTKEGKLRGTTLNQLYAQINKLAGEQVSKALLKSDLKKHFKGTGITLPGS